MGDLGWWYHIRTLITGPRPLLASSARRPADFNDPEWWRDDDAAPALALTDDGARVLAGEADRVALNGIDRWLGGVHSSRPPVGNTRQPSRSGAGMRPRRAAHHGQRT